MGKPKKEKEIAIPTSEEIESFGGSPVSETGKKSVDGKGTATSEIPTEAKPGDAEVVDWKDKFLRAKADFSNYQQRATREMQEAIRYANFGFARTLLDLIDDFERLLQTPAPLKSSEGMIPAVRLMYDKLQKILKDYGVTPIEAIGQPFDPTGHEAILEQPSADHPPRTVIQEVHKGYRMHDRVLRPARVIVSLSAGGKRQSGGADVSSTKEDGDADV